MLTDYLLFWCGMLDFCRSASKYPVFLVITHSLCIVLFVCFICYAFVLPFCIGVWLNESQRIRHSSVYHQNGKRVKVCAAESAFDAL